jgi:hypothetical protein
MRIVFASSMVTGLWVVGTAASLYFALFAPSDSWVQSVASESLVTFLLFLLSPILFFVWKSRSKIRIASSTLVAVGLVAVSSYQDGLSQQLLIGVGCGVVLLQFLDFLVKGAWQAQLAKMEERAREMSGKSNVVLGH